MLPRAQSGGVSGHIIIQRGCTYKRRKRLYQSRSFLVAIDSSIVRRLGKFGSRDGNGLQKIVHNISS